MCTISSLASHVSYNRTYKLLRESFYPPSARLFCWRCRCSSLYCFLESANCALLREHPMTSQTHTWSVGLHLLHLVLSVCRLLVPPHGAMTLRPGQRWQWTSVESWQGQTWLDCQSGTFVILMSLTRNHKFSCFFSGYHQFSRVFW